MANIMTAMKGDMAKPNGTAGGMIAKDFGASGTAAHTKTNAVGKLAAKIRQAMARVGRKITTAAMAHDPSQAMTRVAVTSVVTNWDGRTGLPMNATSGMNHHPYEGREVVSEHPISVVGRVAHTDGSTDVTMKEPIDRQITDEITRNAIGYMEVKGCPPTAIGSTVRPTRCSPGLATKMPNVAVRWTKCVTVISADADRRPIADRMSEFVKTSTIDLRSTPISMLAMLK